MAMTLDECRAVAGAARASGRNYMTMETTVSREFLYVQEQLGSGMIGRIQFLRGAHLQEMSGWPGYWEGLLPMHYATHAISPCSPSRGALAEYVVCFAHAGQALHRRRCLQAARGVRLGDRAAAGRRACGTPRGASALVAAAQEDHAYLNPFFGPRGPAQRYTDLAHGHELYGAGHLFQAAVARLRPASRTT